MFPNDPLSAEMSNSVNYDPYFDGFMYHNACITENSNELASLNTLNGNNLNTMMSMNGIYGSSRVRNLNGQFLGRNEGSTLNHTTPPPRNATRPVAGRRRGRRNVTSISRPRDQRGRFISLSNMQECPLSLSYADNGHVQYS